MTTWKIVVDAQIEALCTYFIEAETKEQARERLLSDDKDQFSEDVCEQMECVQNEVKITNIRSVEPIGRQ